MSIPDEAVEAAAEAHAEHGGETHWEDWEQEAKDEAIADMRAALEAAAPHLMSAIIEDLALQSEDLGDDGLTSIWIRTRKLPSNDPTP